jgi:hypothetical protein
MIQTFNGDPVFRDASIFSRQKIMTRKTAIAFQPVPLAIDLIHRLNFIFFTGRRSQDDQ